MEWTLDQARRCWTPMVRPVQHVGAPGYPFQAAVMWDGSLVFGPLEFLDAPVMRAETAPLGDHRLHVSPLYGDPPLSIDRAGTGDPRIRRELIEGRLPIPRIETLDGNLRWTETVFAHVMGKPALPPSVDPGDILATHVLFRVENAGAARRTGRLTLHFGDTSRVRLGYKCAQDDALAPAIGHRYAAPFGMVGGRVRYLLPAPEQGRLHQRDTGSADRDDAVSAGRAGPPRRALVWEIDLDPGDRAEVRLAIPYGLIDRPAAERLLALDPAAVLDRLRDDWRSIVHGPGQIVTPDPFVSDVLAATAGQMAGQVAYRRASQVWMYKTSPNHYEGYWPCNAAKALPVFDLRGRDDLAVPVLRSFVESQTADVGGLERDAMGTGRPVAGEGFAAIHGFLGNFGGWTANPLLLSHGLGMWALASHYRIVRDDAWLGEGPGSPLQAMIDAFDWTAAQRRRTMREDEDGRRVAHWGLLPAASAHDWLAGSTIFNDAFCIYGMAEVARLLRETGHSRLDAAMSEIADYRACVRGRYAEARDRARRLPLDDGSTIPYVPRMIRESDWAAPDWTYAGYGPLRAGAWGALDPRDELVDQALAFLEAGLPEGEGAVFTAHREHPGTADANWSDVGDKSLRRRYLWRHTIEYETMWPIGGPLFLARDDLPRFFEWLAHTFAATVHADWRVGVESLDGVPSCAPGDAERWLIVRNMLIHETGAGDGSGQSLFLLRAVPRSWLRPNGHLSVRRMGTWFGGTIDLGASVSATGGEITVEVTFDRLRVVPGSVRLRLRSGDGRPLRSATVDGVEARIVTADGRAAAGEGDVIELPRRVDGTIRVVGRFGRAAS